MSVHPLVCWYVTFLICEFPHYRSCPTVRDWIAVYPALFYSTALYKLGPQKQFPKKRKMNDFWLKKDGKGPKIGHPALGKQGEKK